MTRHRLTDEALVSAIELAVRAPSLHNSQPWRFRRDGPGVEVWIDSTRGLPIADSAGRGARLACGAAVLNLRLAFAVQGRPMTVMLLPELRTPELLARLEPGPPRAATPDEITLTAAINGRRSNRAAFVDAPVPLTHRAALVAAAHEESADLTLVTDRTAISDIADVVRQANTQLTNQPGYVDEMRSWTRPDADSEDGVPRSAGGPEPAPHELLARRDFGGAPAPEHRRYEAEPLLAVLGSFGDSPRDQLVAGQALQRVLLTATRLGLATSMLYQPIEVPQSREQLRRLVGHLAIPQMVLRIGFGTPAQATPRRPARSVIDALVHVDPR